MHTRKPKIQPPRFSCDTHAHITGPKARYPLASGLSWDPPDRPIEQYEATLDRLGIDRGIIVQANAHGTDNTVTLDAIAHMKGRCLGIGVIAPSITDHELERLAAGGIRGIRVSTMLKGTMGLNDMAALASRLKALDWHVELHFDVVEHIVPLVGLLRTLPIGVVFDHMGRPRGNQPLDTPGFRALLELLKHSDHCWAKLSSWYRLSVAGAPYADMRPFVDALLEARRDRLLWGSNWPHPQSNVPVPDDADILDQLQEWVGDARDAILVRNPAALYGFTTGK